MQTPQWKAKKQILSATRAEEKIEEGRSSAASLFLCAEHDRQLGGASPLHNVMDVK
jgi:hypothetical protein